MSNTYKGYEIRSGETVKLVKNGQVIEVTGYGIYANGDYKGSVMRIVEAQDFIDKLLEGSLYRPPERTIIRVEGEAWKNTTGH